MTKALRIHELAEDELAKAASWYEGKQPGLGTALLELADQAVDESAQLSYPAVQFPVSGSRRKPGEFFLRPFPYSIVFYESENQIVIVAFAHSSRRPGYWRSREFDTN